MLQSTSFLNPTSPPETESKSSHTRLLLRDLRGCISTPSSAEKEVGRTHILTSFLSSSFLSSSSVEMVYKLRKELVENGNLRDDKECADAAEVSYLIASGGERRMRRKEKNSVKRQRVKRHM